MIRKGFRPSKKLLSCLLLACFLSLLLPFIGHIFNLPEIDFLVYLFAAFFVLTVTVDWLLSFHRPLLTTHRNINQNLSVNIEQTVTLQVLNNGNKNYLVNIEDHIPGDWILLTNSVYHPVLANQILDIEYQTKPTIRGLAELTNTELRVTSRLGFWQFSWLDENKSQVKVYPNFSAISDMAGLNGSVNLTQAGLKKFNLRGSGMDFRQLREYRQGESLKQIDWRATSRFNKLISREFQEEKNQNLVIMLDAGQRMCVSDESMTYFDHALNSLILLSHTALKNGDNLSIQSFGAETRWLGQIKGAQNISKILHHFYDLYPQKTASDYLRSAQDLLNKQPKRALILLVSCLRDEDFSDLLDAVRLLQKKHLVAVMSISEPIYQSILNKQVEGFEDALLFASTQILEQSIARNLKRLKKQGVICIHAPVNQLTSNVINTYLSVKNAGLL
jgi:uncharacterized protein (DUF58 family)